jgi:hypothetical protein
MDGGGMMMDFTPLPRQLLNSPRIIILRHSSPSDVALSDSFYDNGVNKFRHNFIMICFVCTNEHYFHSSFSGAVIDTIACS